MSDQGHDIAEERLLAYLDGQLDGAAAEEVGALIEQSPEVRAEFEWLKLLKEDLEQMGDAIVADAPEVNLLAGVMRGVAEARRSEEIVHLEHERAQRRTWSLPPWTRWGLAAASVAVVALAWYFGAGLLGSDSNEPRVAQSPVGTPPDSPHQPREKVVWTATKQPLRTKEEYTASRQRLAQRFTETIVSQLSQPDQFATTPSPELKALTLSEVVAARKQAVSDAAAWAKLNGWATLEPDVARAVIAKEGISPRAAAAAAGSLDAKEARDVISASIAQSPDDPYLRLALARTYTHNPATDGAIDFVSAGDAAKLQEQVQWGQQFDPNNALFHLLDSMLCFEANDVAAGCAALERAQQQDFASAYSSAGTQGTMESLIAAGMDQETAQAVAGLTAGANEYADLRALGDSLLEYGQECVNNGDLETARSIYQAVQRMGEQVGDGAAYSQELLASVEIGLAAYDFAGSLELVFDDEQTAALLSSSVANLEALVTELGDTVGALTHFFLQDPSAEALTDVFQQLVEVGDIVLFGTAE